MKKTFIIGSFVGAVIVVSLLALAVVGYSIVRAQAPTQTPFGGGYGPGMMGGRGAASAPGYGASMMGGRGTGMMSGGGMMGGRGMMANGNTSLMHTYMVDALAQELGLKSEDVQSRLDKGETPYQIAQSLNKTDAEITALMQTVHQTALEKAVAAGSLTQAQANWMDQHMDQMWQNGLGPGTHCTGLNAQPTVTAVP